MGWGTKLQKTTHRAVPLVQAQQIAATNAKHHERLENTRLDAQRSLETARDDLDRANRLGFDEFLAPFAGEFARLKNVDLGELRVLDEVPELAALGVEMRKVAVDAVRGLTSLAGGAAAGASAGAVTFTAVGAFAAASTGTAITSLSGAAATSATLAWLGGGSLAAGGGGVAAGTAVLTGIVAAPVLLAAGGFLYWQGKKSLDSQKRLAQELRRAETQLNRDCDQIKLAAKRCVDAARVVQDLARVGSGKLPELRRLLDRNVDFASYPVADRAKVAELAGLAQAIAAVIACPLVDESGSVTEAGATMLAAAEAVAHAHA